MRPAAPEVCGASYAFRDSVVEAAFVAFSGRSSRRIAVVVRIVLLAAWAVRLVTWALSPHDTPNLGGSLIIVAATSALLAVVLRTIAQLATDQRFVLHEWMKSRSHIWYLILAMVKLIGLSRLGKLQQAAAVMTFFFSIVVCFDRVRVPVASRLYGLSLVSYTITQVHQNQTLHRKQLKRIYLKRSGVAGCQSPARLACGVIAVATWSELARRKSSPAQAVQWLDHPAHRDLGAECRCLCSLLAGQAMLLALTAVREMRGRMRFLQLHPSEQRQPLPPFWKTLSGWVPAPQPPQTP